MYKQQLSHIRTWGPMERIIILLACLATFAILISGTSLRMNEITNHNNQENFEDKNSRRNYINLCCSAFKCNSNKPDYKEVEQILNVTKQPLVGSKNTTWKRVTRNRKTNLEHNRNPKLSQGRVKKITKLPVKTSTVRTPPRLSTTLRGKKSSTFKIEKKLATTQQIVTALNTLDYKRPSKSRTIVANSKSTPKLLNVLDYTKMRTTKRKKATKSNAKTTLRNRISTKKRTVSMHVTERRVSSTSTLHHTSTFSPAKISLPRTIQNQFTSLLLSTDVQNKNTWGFFVTDDITKTTGYKYNLETYKTTDNLFASTNKIIKNYIPVQFPSTPFSMYNLHEEGTSYHKVTQSYLDFKTEAISFPETYVTQQHTYPRKNIIGTTESSYLTTTLKNNYPTYSELKNFQPSLTSERTIYDDLFKFTTNDLPYKNDIEIYTKEKTKRKSTSNEYITTSPNFKTTRNIDSDHNYFFPTNLPFTDDKEYSVVTDIYDKKKTQSSTKTRYESKNTIKYPTTNIDNEHAEKWDKNEKQTKIVFTSTMSSPFFHEINEEDDEDEDEDSIPKTIVSSSMVNSKQTEAFKPFSTSTTVTIMRQSESTKIVLPKTPTSKPVQHEDNEEDESEDDDELDKTPAINKLSSIYANKPADTTKLSMISTLVTKITAPIAVISKDEDEEKDVEDEDDDPKPAIKTSIAITNKLNDVTVTANKPVSISSIGIIIKTTLSNEDEENDEDEDEITTKLRETTKSPLSVINIKPSEPIKLSTAVPSVSHESENDEEDEEESETSKRKIIFTTTVSKQLDTTKATIISLVPTLTTKIPLLTTSILKINKENNESTPAPPLTASKLSESIKISSISPSILTSKSPETTKLALVTTPVSKVITSEEDEEEDSEDGTNKITTHTVTVISINKPSGIPTFLVSPSSTLTTKLSEIPKLVTVLTTASKDEEDEESDEDATHTTKASSVLTSVKLVSDTTKSNIPTATVFNSAPTVLLPSTTTKKIAEKNGNDEEEEDEDVDPTTKALPLVTAAKVIADTLKPVAVTTLAVSVKVSETTKPIITTNKNVKAVEEDAEEDEDGEVKITTVTSTSAAAKAIDTTTKPVPAASLAVSAATQATTVTISIAKTTKKVAEDDEADEENDEGNNPTTKATPLVTTAKGLDLFKLIPSMPSLSVTTLKSPSSSSSADEEDDDSEDKTTKASVAPAVPNPGDGFLKKFDFGNMLKGMPPLPIGGGKPATTTSASKDEEEEEE